MYSSAVRQFGGSFVDPTLNASPSPPPATTFSSVSNARRWTVVSLLFIASVINYFDRATISFALPLISRDFHLNPASEGVLLSAFFWSYTLMQLPIGAMADRIDLLWVYAASFALWSLAQGMTGVAASVAVLIVLRILLGAGESIYLPGGTKIVASLFRPDERGAPSGFFDFGTRIGIAAGGLVMPLLLARFGWRLSFVAVGIFGLIWLIPWFATFPSKFLKPKASVAEGGRASRSAEIFTVLLCSVVLLVFFPLVFVVWGYLAWRKPRRIQSKPRPGPRGVVALVRELLHDRNLLGIFLGFFCFDYFWYLMVTWLPDYLYQERHLGILKAGLYAALPYFVFGICEPTGGWITDRLIQRGWDETRTRKGVLTFGFLFGLLIIPAARVSSAGAAVALITASGLVGLSTANLLVIVQSCAPPGEIGIWTGFENFAGNVGGILAPLVTGVLINWTGSFLPAFILGPAILLSGLLAYWFIVGKIGQPVPDSAAAS
jgi:ACS family D-galactonate transporter-like MFS transporter